MKKIYLTLILFIVSLFASFIAVFAANTALTINGADSLTTGSTGKMSVQITSNDKIGGIEGVITKSSNITSIKVIAKNGWNNPLYDEEKGITYNEETGNFILLKNSGASSGEVMEIEYTVSNATGTGKIEIKDITVSSLREDYEEEEVEAISKNISIIESQQDDDPGKQDDNPGKQDDDPGKQDDDPEKKDQVKNKTIQNNSATSSKTSLPKTGSEKIILIVILLIGIATGVLYRNYRRYKGL